MDSSLRIISVSFVLSIYMVCTHCAQELPNSMDTLSNDLNFNATLSDRPSTRTCIVEGLPCLTYQFNLCLGSGCPTANPPKGDCCVDDATNPSDLRIRCLPEGLFFGKCRRVNIG